MRYDELIATVRRRGEHAGTEESERITRAVLSVLGRRLPADTATGLAARLPDEFAVALLGQSGNGETFDAETFLSTLATELRTSLAGAKWDASAVLSTVADAIDEADLDAVLEHLPRGYADLFGHAEMA